VIGGDYLRAMQIPIIAGRAFTDFDSADSPPVVIIDQYLVNRYFANRSPLGQQIRRGGPTSPAFTIVGVAGTINSIDLGQPVAKERIYYPVAQQPRPSMALVVKSAVDQKTLVSQVRSAVMAIDPEQPIADVRTMDEWLARSLEGRRSPMLLLALFGGVALVLSAIGIYGVLAFAVAQRTREIGIRQALGADRRSILALVLKQGMSTAGIGVGFGLAGAIALTRYLQTMLFGVGAHDVQVYVAVTVVLLSVATAACYVPARRATAVDPNQALRDT
jgi:predicted permease